MRIPKDVILIWAGSNASIPTNWLRETSLDGKYPKAWGAQNPNITGGAQNHTHTSPAHTHAIADHTHTYTVPAAPYRDTAWNQNYGSAVQQGHTHIGSTGGVVSSNNFGSTAVTYGTCSNDPPYQAVIFIKANYGALLADNLIALWGGYGGNTNVPSNYQLCNGANSSPDLRNKYLKGAGTGADAGATGGSTTNVHDISHGHTGASHQHAGYTTSGAQGYRMATNGGSTCCSVCEHSHTYDAVNATTVTPNNHSGSLTTPETVEPAYKKLCAIQKKTGAIKEKGLIGLWLGAVADIPRGWVLCDGNNGTPDMRDKYLKIANDTTEIGNTGGSNTHTHSAQSHSHTVPAHNHYQPQTKNHYGIWRESMQGGAGNYDDTLDSDTHPAYNVDNASPSTTSANTTADSASNEPEYRTALYIQYQYATDGGFFLENFI